MSEVSQLLTTVERQLKLQGKTYRDVAASLQLSEASAKRLLTSDTRLLLALREWERAAFTASRR
jgi:DNA-binding CsgD family transcriptional regulator